jgi:hypothetical protein
VRGVPARTPEGYVVGWDSVDFAVETYLLATLMGGDYCLTELREMSVVKYLLPQGTWFPEYDYRVVHITIPLWTVGLMPTSYESSINRFNAYVNT